MGSFRRWRRCAIVCVALIVASWPSFADEPVVLVRSAELQDAATSGIGLTVDAAGYHRLQSTRLARVRDFPLPSGTAVDLELAAFDVLAPGARLVWVDDQGEHDATLGDFRAFRGIVVGDPSSVVTLSLYDDRIAGSLRTGGEEFVVATRAFDTAAGTLPILGVWNGSEDPERSGGPRCDGDRHPAVDSASISGLADPDTASAGVAIDDGTELVAHIAIDATYEWYSRFGSLDQAQSYILSLMAQVSTVYSDEINVTLEVPHLRIFTSPNDPYTATTDTSTLLADLRSEWNANRVGIDRTAAHLFSTRSGGGSGLAYVDVLCSNAYRPGDSYDYGVSTMPANGGSWEYKLVAHELGHNFSSPHTHCYSPEIDRCATASGCYGGPAEQSVGTIMSYCNVSELTFHSRVRDRIRPAAEAAYGACIDLADGFSDPLVAPENLHRTDRTE